MVILDWLARGELDIKFMALRRILPDSPTYITAPSAKANRVVKAALDRRKTKAT